ncbi:di-trans,poly-cis-decaprenylcistransferase [Patescibacteria group bacterium]|nr:MAG: di-trans,poly-cis-decaprenylcistransferase [Patescibacteria group bacterium]
MPSPAPLTHLGIILDGNRTWARARGLPTLEGHRRGYDRLKEFGDWCIARRIPVITAFVFSTENWDRPPEEVAYLMDLLEGALTREVGEFDKRGIRLKIIGRRERLAPSIVRAIDAAEARTAKNDKITLRLAMNYGGRAEIVDAAKKAIAAGAAPESLTEESFRNFLYEPETPDPDMIIRTADQKRLSGFLLWGAAYSEFYFTPTLWPDFSEQDLDAALAEYANRTRKFGK